MISLISEFEHIYKRCQCNVVCSACNPSRPHLSNLVEKYNLKRKNVNRSNAAWNAGYDISILFLI